MEVLLIEVRQLHEPLPQHRRVLRDARGAKVEPTAKEPPVLTRPRQTETIVYLLSCERLRIYHLVDAETIEVGKVLGQEIVVIAHPGKGLLDPHPMGDHTGEDIGTLRGSHCDEEVSLLHPRMLQLTDGGRITHDRHNLERIVVGKVHLIRILVHQDHIVVLLLTDQLSQVGAGLACSNYKNSHRLCSTKRLCTSLLILSSSMPTYARWTDTSPCLMYSSPTPRRRIGIDTP